MPETTILDAIRFLSIGCLAVILGQLLVYRGERSRVTPALLLTACAMDYVLVDWQPLHFSSLYLLFLAGAFGLPYAFYLFSRSLFDDGFQLRFKVLWPGLAVVLLQFLFYFLRREKFVAEDSAADAILQIAQYALSLLFVMIGMAAALRKREEDLILARYRFRINFVAFTAALILLTLVSELVFAEAGVPVWLEALQKLAIGGLAFYLALRQLSFRSDFLFATATPAPVPETSPVDTALLETLQEQMDEQKAWQTEGLTIRQLAEQMDVKEYRLRQAINQGLGFRNFNDYLHSFRIEEACRQLSSPAQREQTVLEIAYAVGYNSLAPFNKAFKQKTGMTPTEWRQNR